MVGRIFYNKLIRDKIPEKIAARGSTCETYTLSESEFERELVKKVEEEAGGMSAAKTREELIEEMVDVQDVLDEVKTLKGITNEELKAAHEKMREKKGGFEKRLFLTWSSDDGYTTNEKRNV